MREILFYDANPSVRKMLIPDLEGLGMRVIVIDAIEALEDVLRRSRSLGLLILDMTRQPEQLPKLQELIPRFIATPEHCILTTMMPTALARFLPANIELCFFKHVVERPFKRLDFLSFIASIVGSAMLRGGAAVQPFGHAGSFSSNISQITGDSRVDENDAELLERVSGILEIQEERALGAFPKDRVISLQNPATTAAMPFLKPPTAAAAGINIFPPVVKTQAALGGGESLALETASQKVAPVAEEIKAPPPIQTSRQPISRRSLITQDSLRAGSSGLRPKHSSDTHSKAAFAGLGSSQGGAEVIRGGSSSRPRIASRLAEPSFSPKADGSGSDLNAQVPVVSAASGTDHMSSNALDGLLERRLPGPIGRLSHTQGVRVGLEKLDFSEGHNLSSEFSRARTEIPVPSEAIEVALQEHGASSVSNGAVSVAVSVANANTEIPVPKSEIAEAIKQLQAEEAAEVLARESAISNSSLPQVCETSSPMENIRRWANTPSKQNADSEKDNSVLSSMELAKNDALFVDPNGESENTAIMSVVTVNDIIKPSLKAGLSLKGEREQALLAGQFSLESLILAIEQSYIQERRFTLEIGVFPNPSVMILFGGRVLWIERLSAGLVRTSGHFLHSLPLGTDYKAKAIENLMSQGMDMNAAITTLELNALFSSVCEESVLEGIGEVLGGEDSTFVLYPGLIERYKKLVSERPATGISVANYLYNACREGRVSLGQAAFIDYAHFVARPYRTPFNRSISLEAEALKCLDLVQSPRCLANFDKKGRGDQRALLHRLWVFGFLDTVSF